MLSLSCRSMEKEHLSAAHSSWPGIKTPGLNVAFLQSFRVHDIFIVLGKLVLMSPTGHGVVSRFRFFRVLGYPGK
jgi:hypothetical protein